MVDVKGLYKAFPAASTQRKSLKSTILSLPKSLFNLVKNEKKDNLRYGLKDISFSINKGEVLGVIGKNGSGKSTLAKVLAGVTYPTSGEVCIQGRVAGLLELGAGFHPDLSAKENVYLNGMLLGLRKSDIDKRIDNILEFAGLTKRSADPIRSFSTGMQMRLGYAIATNVSADLLIIDEALAVGDEQFQNKCKLHLKRLRDEGVTMIVITHDLGFIQSECTQALLLNEGQIIAYGEVAGVLEHYHSLAL